MSLLTLLDIAKANGSDAVVGLIDEVSQAHPELTGMVRFAGQTRTIPNVGASRTIKGLNYKTLVRTGLPTVGFRSANQGTAYTKGTLENRLVETFIMNPRWGADKAVADRDEDGPEAAIAREAAAHMEAALQALARQFYYGTTSAGDTKGHPGLIQSYSTDIEVDAGGTTVDTGSSVWAVSWGPQGVQWVWGNNGQLQLSDVDERDMTDGDGEKYTGYHQELLAYPGLQVGSTRAVGRIKKITEDSGHTLTDDMISDLLSKFPTGYSPDVLFMTRRSLKQLQQSRTATNATGAPAPFPTESHGVPIAVTDAIANTEPVS